MVQLDSHFFTLSKCARYARAASRTRSSRGISAGASGDGCSASVVEHHVLMALGCVTLTDRAPRGPATVKTAALPCALARAARDPLGSLFTENGERARARGRGLTCRHVVRASVPLPLVLGCTAARMSVYKHCAQRAEAATMPRPSDAFTRSYALLSARAQSVYKHCATFRGALLRCVRPAESNTPS